ncbi:hybrid sensor histidine kinase/response regulator [Maribacter aestuarii]|uniref:hybrid sensor histidine kinase/response regulator n=1 Tax=Maribacter aestuarii TaxID=1130723 RepID=UPI0025A5BEED|nr:ATP-binding protein [Maribacter aestuarii]
MNKPKNKFTLKIILSYLLLVVLALVASFYVYSEIRDYLSTEVAEENDAKLLKTSSFLTQLYEAESHSKLALQSKKRKDFVAYASKIDSIYTDIEQLKTFTNKQQQQYLLDSLRILLAKKVANTEMLGKLKTQNQTGTAITSALEKFDEMEASLGIITAEGLVPNLNELSPKAREAIQKVADYLNANIPTDDTEEQKTKKLDSVLEASKALLMEVQQENTINENSLARREMAINKTDLELSQQLRNILSAFENEIMVNSFNDNIKKEAALKRSIRLASIAALLGFLVVGLFIFILNKDFWKAHLYRQKLEKEKKFSESLLKSREQLIATVSHDLRTPLSAITGYAKLLENTGLPRQQERYVEYIKSATGYINNLVNDLLDFSQLEAGKMTAEKISFNLYELLTETAQNIASTNPEKEIVLVLDMDHALQSPIISDPKRIRQIISNLIGNAYKFTQKGKISITAKVVGTSETKQQVNITVTDTGIGISKEKQQLIFNEFTQAENDTDKKYGGYGLGLTISKKLTELLGGSIRLESTLGEGSTFVLEFPLVFSSPLESKTLPALEELSKKNISILIIDDDSSFLQMIGEMVKTTHITPILFNSFDELTQTKKKIRYDLILTDIEMPTISGFEVMKRLSSGSYKHYDNQPIIAMTGRHDLKEELFTSQGFSTVIKKPFSKIKLLETINLFLSEGDLKIDTKTSTPEIENYQLYSLKTSESFLGDDMEAIDEILKTFLDDTLVNRALLKKAVKVTDYNDINKTAHRMLTMFRQLQVNRCIPTLEILEIATAESLSMEKLKMDFKSLDEGIGRLICELKKRPIRHLDHSG